MSSKEPLTDERLQKIEKSLMDGAAPKLVAEVHRLRSEVSRKNFEIRNLQISIGMCLRTIQALQNPTSPPPLDVEIPPSMACTCIDSAHSRSLHLGFPKGPEQEHAEQRCPFTTLVLGKPTVCSCCQTCTLLCLPRKTVMLGSKREAVADLYGEMKEWLRR